MRLSLGEGNYEIHEGVMLSMPVLLAGRSIECEDWSVVEVSKYDAAGSHRRAQAALVVEWMGYLHYHCHVQLWSLLLPLFLFLPGCSDVPPQGTIRAALVRGDMEIPLWIEVADDPEERTQGLMGRAELPRNQGMLFVFDTPRKLSFWMKNTLIPLDILFFDQNFDFVNSVAMEPCKNDPCQTYPSRWPAQYALEVRKGFVREYTIEKGWKLRVDLAEAKETGSGGVVSGE